jgi:O-antigen biosynthesis protein
MAVGSRSWAAERREAANVRQPALLVLGMHRSGTSAVARVLSLLGAALPRTLLDTNHWNEAGYWEPRHLVDLHDRMLAEAGSRWDDWRIFDPSVLGPGRSAFYAGEIERIIADEYGDAPWLVIKDPRICRFAGLYEEVLERLGFDVRFLLIHRNPLDVVASLAGRDEMTDGFAGLLWLRHVLEAEWATRGKPRAVLAYEALLADWRQAMRGVADSLGLAWPVDPHVTGTQIDAYLSRGLQHHHRTLEDLAASGDVLAWLKETYAALLALSNGGSEGGHATAVLSRIRGEFDISTAFGHATFPELAARERRMAADVRHLSELVQQRDLDAAAACARVAALDATETHLTRELQVRGEELWRLEQRLAGRDVVVARQRDELGRLEQRLADRDVVVARQWDELGRLEQRLADRDALVARQHDERARLDQVLANRDATLAVQRDELEEASRQMAAKAAEFAALADAHEEQIAWGKTLHRRVGGLELELGGVYASRSWRLTAPLRLVRRAGRASRDGVRRLASRLARTVYHGAPLPMGGKRRIKDALFRRAAPLIRHTMAYRAWQGLGRGADNREGEVAYDAGGPAGRWQRPPVEYVSRLEAAPLAHKPVRVIAFYLPQFHPIPENDAWWGKGFTEWTNVRPAEPQFAGHYQPHVPGELGYYDLRNPSVQRRQIELAQLYGVEGFCFYYYRFGRTRLLEKPLENWLSDSSLDLPFCLCWANENWTRRWDGLENEVLIAQQYSAEDDIALIEEVAPYLADRRAIRVDGKPLFLVYRPGLLPSAKATAARWRAWCRANGIGEIFLAYTQSFEHIDPRHVGFDAAVEFPPNNSHPPNITASTAPLDPQFSGTVYDWSIFPARSERYAPRDYPLFRAVCPGWDSTPRLKNRGTVFVNNTPAGYRRWLENAIRDTLEHVREPSQRLVFVNAWNEWAEGAHLEPDGASGYAYLQATRDALEQAARERQPSVVIVSHDAHPHGAQLNALSMARGFRALGLRPEVIVLEGGELLPRFEEVATVHRVDLSRDDERDVLARLKALRAGGAEVALANTTVSGALVPLLVRAGFRTLALVHELPGILESYGLERRAAAIADHAGTVVFAAQAVRSGFERFLGRPVHRAAIRPQGSYMRMAFDEVERAGIRCTVRDRLGLRPDARIMLGAGYGDHRKGLDLFVDVGLAVMAVDPRAAAVWAGKCDPTLFERQLARIRAAGVERRFVFTGFLERPQEFFVAADVYALTSREDPFPSVVMEALDAGVPVVAFAGTGGFEELLARGCGLLVPALETHEMATAVGALFNDPDRAAALARRGRAIVRWDLNPRHYLHDLLHLAGTPLPRVSVVVPNYNYGHYLADRLASIARQTVAPYEIIVLDDGSTDASVAVIEQSLARLDAASVLIRNEQNSGSAFRQWMRGVELARGDFVWIAEADDLADPVFLAEVLPAFERPDVVLSYCQSRQMDADGRILSEHYLDYVADLDRERWTLPYVADGRDEIARGLFVKNTIPNVSAVLFRRDVLHRTLVAHAQEITSFRYAGDWVAYLRLLEQGAIAFSPRARNSHRRHAASLTVANFTIGQLREIVHVQQDTITRHRLGDRARAGAAAYAQRLYQQFGLATPKHPVCQDHPELAALGGPLP